VFARIPQRARLFERNKIERTRTCFTPNRDTPHIFLGQFLVLSGQPKVVHVLLDSLLSRAYS
jgi:hypothetical protein